MRGVWTDQNPIQAGLFTRADQEQNAREIWGYFQAKGWTLHAVCGMLGNMEAESYINPGQWQLGGIIEDPNPQNVEGFGLVQWTPWQKYVDSSNWFGDWQAGPNWRSDYIKQLDRIQYEVDFDAANPNQGQWIAVYDSTFGYVNFTLFTQLTYSPLYDEWFVKRLTEIFFTSYERGTWSSIRGDYAWVWYQYLSGVGPVPPHGRLPIWLLFKLREANFQ